jgi:hypothetical protein
MPEILDDPDDPRNLEEKLELASERVLDSVQDFVSEDLTMPWPDPTNMQVPGAEATAERIRLWYGDREEPFLSLPDIPIEELR